MPSHDPAAVPSTRLTDAERAWLHARAAELGVAAGQAHAGPLSAGADGRIVLSTDASASALPPLAGLDGVPVFLAEQACLGTGETLVVTSPRCEPVHVVLGRLTAANGGAVTIGTPAELSAAAAVMGPGSEVRLIGRDGVGGYPGEAGRPGQHVGLDGGPGGPGERGGRGEDGPDGALWFGEISGTLTVVARGGRGGEGGLGGRGGDGFRYIGHGRGGGGGGGGRGGDGANGGAVVIAFGALAPGAAIHPRGELGAGGSGGEPGPGGAGNPPGGPGAGGHPGTPGELPSFSIRHRP